MGENLLLAIQQVLSLPDDHSAIIAWGEAYGILANVFIKAEKELYSANLEQSGGWEGFRDFYIDRIVQETPEVKSFYFKPMDLKTVPNFKGGQYIGVRVRPNNSDYSQIRQYSLSLKNDENKLSNNTLRISVKAERDGLVSNYLHNCQVGTAVSLQAPTGVFTLQKQDKKCIFIAGGVGITPLMSMMQEALSKGSKADDILFIQCAKDEDHQIFQKDLVNLQATHGFQHKLCYENSAKGDHQGYLNQTIIAHWLEAQGFDNSNSQVYFCGPKSFMAVLNQFFLNLGFDADDIHYEVFGPTTNL